MPRPVRPIQIMMAVMVPPGIHACTRRGFHIQTTPLSGNHQMMLDQVAAHTSAKAEMGDQGKHLTLSLSRVAFICRSPAERQTRIEQAESYYSRFDNVFTGPGIVENGMIKPLPRKQTIDELAQSLLICTPQEMIDKLSPYAEAGVDRMILNINFGATQSETLDCIHRFAEEVMPHFTDRASLAAE